MQESHHHKDRLRAERVHKQPQPVRALLQFRFESFNTINHVNYGLVNDTFAAGPDGRNSSATFGTIVTARDARINQLGLKLIF